MDDLLYIHIVNCVNGNSRTVLVRVNAKMDIILFAAGFSVADGVITLEYEVAVARSDATNSIIQEMRKVIPLNRTGDSASFLYCGYKVVVVRTQ